MITCGSQMVYRIRRIEGGMECRQSGIGMHRRVIGVFVLR